MRMRERGDRARLSLEAATAIRIGRQLRGQDLQSDTAIETRVTGSVDLTHTAGADRCNDFIGPEDENP